MVLFAGPCVIESEENILTKIAAFLHFSSPEFEAMMNQFQSHFSGVQTHSSLSESYKTLGASKEDDLKTIKKKYI